MGRAPGRKNFTFVLFTMLLGQKLEGKTVHHWHWIRKQIRFAKIQKKILVIQNVVHGPAAWASPGNLLEAHALHHTYWVRTFIPTDPHPRGFICTLTLERHLQNIHHYHHHLRHQSVNICHVLYVNWLTTISKESIIIIIPILGMK